MHPPPRAGTDQELLRATLGGDEESFVEIYRRYRDRVYRFACRMTDSAELARDITHHREVLVLVEYEDLDLATVAEIVGAEVGAVKVRLHRARRKLRAALEAHARRGAVTVT